VTDAIKLERLTKAFGPKVAVNELDMVVRQGGLYGYIGPNGAGKTTTIRMIMSILFPDSGRISVLGHDSALEAKDRIGYLPEERGVYKKMKVGAFLRYIARLKGHGRAGLPKKVRDWLERLELADVEGKRCDELSKGMQQKVQFISTVIHEPELLILDEPFSGLDPVNMRLLRDLIMAEHRRGATIIFSTHVMTQAEQLCDHILMIHDGRKVLDESLESIRTKYDPRIVQVEPLNPQADVSSLKSMPGVREVTKANGAYELQLGEGTDVASIMREIVSAIPVARVELHRPTLEDVFVQIVTGSRHGKAEAAHEIRAALQPESQPAEGYGA
jgi:ABC-2 type transport system ATP-binding protein